MLRRLFSTHALVVADHGSGRLSKSSFQVISAARKMNGKVTVGLFGEGLEEVAKQAANIAGVSAVVCVSGNPFRVAESLAEGIAVISKKISATHIVGSTGSSSKDALPRVGALLNSQPISDVIDVVSDSVFKRPMYAGNVIATVESRDAVRILTVRPTAFPGEEGSSSSSASSAPITLESGITVLSSAGAVIEGEESKKDDSMPDLATARVVVAGGRGLKSKENFDSILSPLCTKLKGAALAASRAAVDAGFAPNDLQVGQTGKVVAPDLYIAVGISGAIQHVAGMKDSRTIVAINKDKDAAIFQCADYGLVGDLFSLVPELTSKL